MYTYATIVCVQDYSVCVCVCMFHLQRVDICCARSQSVPLEYILLRMEQPHAIYNNY